MEKESGKVRKVVTRKLLSDDCYSVTPPQVKRDTPPLAKSALIQENNRRESQHSNFEGFSEQEEELEIFDIVDYMDNMKKNNVEQRGTD